MPSHRVPELRVTRANDAPLRADGDHVLYWMTAARRTRFNFALDRALEHATELGKPLLVLESLRSGYEWANDRLHRFLLEGMAANRAAFEGTSVRHHAYVEPEDGAGRGLLAAMAARACVVVTDEFPCFFLPRMIAAAARALPVRLEQVDGNGLIPLRAPDDRVFGRAVDLRRWIQRNLDRHLGHAPRANPLARLELPRARLPRELLQRWPAATEAQLRAEPGALAALPIDHDVAPSPVLRGGEEAGRHRLRAFLRDGLARYDEDRNHPDREGGSGLSPWLHFGHVSVHEVFAQLARHQGWTPDRLGSRADGGRDGFWNMSPPADAFLDELVTWRELGLNFCFRRDDYDRYESLPDWAQQTLAEHESDAREHLYTFEELDEARTHDEVWNAAQTQLRLEGRMHNYLRMLWGKKVLKWSPSPRIALEILIELNNRYAIDGRDPNSYSGIFWVFGRYDRPWGPERPIFGKVRYMTSESTRRKLQLKGYLARYGGGAHG